MVVVMHPGHVPAASGVGVHSHTTGRFGNACWCAPSGIPRKYTSCICAIRRVLEQLIEARAAEQNFSSQLATKAGQVQQLACDRDLALQKLCHSEEKLVALESQLISLEGQLQERQEGIAAQVAALDVAALAAGPLAGAREDMVVDGCYRQAALHVS